MAEYNVTLFDRGSVYVNNNVNNNVLTMRLPLLLFNASIADFNNCNFYKNLAKRHVTMVYIIGGGTLTLRPCELTHNNAMEDW